MNNLDKIKLILISESVTVTLAPATTNDQVPSTSSACKRKLAPDEQEVEELIKYKI